MFHPPSQTSHSIGPQTPPQNQPNRKPYTKVSQKVTAAQKPTTTKYHPFITHKQISIGHKSPTFCAEHAVQLVDVAQLGAQVVRERGGINGDLRHFLSFFMIYCITFLLPLFSF
ncbi:hypothetical protein BofuT4_P087100.1 [Botrytis cinerea T4]|uniref:Uncharacterized protein n=1 Tax=Botryotinia fuckeliana (strain T4) TaxID=999810 RepID=G2YGA8_BOTF4|nr:hypothetical protein BofuT4_P087100.1 [Botrytis cinerea T4]